MIHVFFQVTFCILLLGSFTLYYTLFGCCDHSVCQKHLHAIYISIAVAKALAKSCCHLQDWGHPDLVELACKYGILLTLLHALQSPYTSAPSTESLLKSTTAIVTSAVNVNLFRIFQWKIAAATSFLQK